MKEKVIQLNLHTETMTESSGYQNLVALIKFWTGNQIAKGIIEVNTAIHKIFQINFKCHY